MPNLKQGEKMQRCQCKWHDTIRRQKYYIKRKYYNELEQHFCAGCCNILEQRGVVKYSIGDGYSPVGDWTFKEILERYTAEAFNGR